MSDKSESPNFSIENFLLELDGVAYSRLDAQNCLVAFNPGLARYVADPVETLLPGAALSDVFPELFGYEPVFDALRQGLQPGLQMEYVFRENISAAPGDINLSLLPLEQALLLFLPGKVVDAMLAQEASPSLAGVLSDVTVLFADLRGFTSWSADRDPEVVMAVLNRVFSPVIELLLEQGATLDKYIGDTIMAYFNAPGDKPDHAQRALESASRIGRLPSTCIDLQSGIGLNSGSVTVGNPGTLQAMQYSSTVIAQTPGSCNFQHLGGMNLRGWTADMDVYQLVHAC